MTDECHRPQFGLITGFANNLRKALPKDSFICFTGTPVDSKDANTAAVFGESPSYPLQRAGGGQLLMPMPIP
ncbi:MAG: hypothetical protein ACO1OF_22490 [Adhaeribacter sp.]